MARVTKPKKEVSMEEALWKAADKLRGSVEPAEYKHVVLSLFFLKFASDKFEAQRTLIAEKFGEKFIDTLAFYTKDNVFYLPAESRWSFIMENAKQDDIALKIDTALYTIEKTNPALKGALPDNYYSRLHIDTNKLASLLDEIDKINTDDKENLLFDMKWMAKLEADIRDEIEQVLNSLSSKVLLIAKRYEHTLGEIEARTAKSRAAVVAALERMGYKW